MSVASVHPRDIRESPIAGTWYPGTAQELTRMLAEFLAKVPPQTVPGRLIGLIVPHAGLFYSGPVAAYAYRQLQGKSYDLVVIIAPSHRTRGAGILATRKQYYQTPLGLVEVDTGIVQAIAKATPVNLINQDMEHAVEIQLPFLQHLLPPFRLVPLMLENQMLGTAQGLAGVLAPLLKGKKALLIASTDLSHYYNYAQATSLDKRAVDVMQQFDPVAFDQTIASGRSEACGYGAVTTVMLIAQALGADTVTLLHYANSGDVTGDRSQVVGYAALAISARQDRD